MQETTVFQSGNSQAVRISKEMRFDCEKVLIEKVGNVVVIIETKDSWASAKLGQAFMKLMGAFMPEGRSVNPMKDGESGEE